MDRSDPAVGRFWVIQMARIGAFLMAVIGALIIGKIIEAPEVLGYALLVLGAAEYFILPKILSKRWKTPE